MNIDWQNTIVLVLVVAAGLYVIRRIWRVVRGKESGTCATCEECQPSGEKLIPLDPPPKKK